MKQSKRIILPNNYFEKNEIQAIKSIIGNDIKIISYNKADEILHNNNCVVDVEYDCLDFSPFDIYFVDEVKKLNVNSEKYVAKINNKIVKLKLDSKRSNFYIRISPINFSTTTEETVEINYNGFEVNENNLLCDFCTIFGNKYLTFHGNTVTSNPKFNLRVKPDIKKDNKAFNRFRSINKKDIKTFNHELELSNKIIDKPIVFDFSDMKKEEIIESINNTSKGIFILIHNRSSPYSVIYIPDLNFRISNIQKEYLLDAIFKDIENYEKFYGKS